ncbi:ATP-binding protein [Roseinatronobacter sp. S2]|uniref:ATP-binding protein n=1 Tax=Roseinatronobacter sp. S2 TaxID=3035471 RepID=UPI00240F2287|nr:ATP-binding protein [Roseinatronobacter sp. S2]WFE74672.1 ATP-binding protein [Roseinatronobacter sp. S2]
MSQGLERARHAVIRKTNVPALLAFVVVIAGWIAAETQSRNTYIQAQRNSVLAQAAVLRADLEGTVNGTIQPVRGLIATIATEPDMDQTRFAELASRLIEDQQVLRNVGAAPDMVIQMMYPIAGNEQAIGLDYTRHPDQREAALRARALGQLVLAGPVDLLQGGQGFIGRFPVFLPREDGTSEFWGLVSAVMDVDVLYQQAGLDDDLPFAVTLTGRDATGAQGPAFFGPTVTQEDEPVITYVQLPTGSWQIAALPHGGWQTQPPQIWTTRALLLLAAVLILGPSIQMGRLMEARQHAIRELKSANNILHRQMQEREAARVIQQETEAQLRYSLQQQQDVTNRFQDVADISRSWVWEVDADLRFTHVSDTFLRLTELPAESVLGHTRAEIFADNPEALQSADWDTLAARVARWEPFSGFVHRMVTAKGRELWVQVSGSPIFDAQGQFAGYRGAGMDVTEMQVARAAAEESNRIKTMFLANMSHEIRTPLNGVLGMAEALREVLPDPAHQKMAKTIRDSGEGLLQILNDILDISKIEAGKMLLDEAHFNPEDVVNQVVALHSPCSIEKGLDVLVKTGDAKTVMRRGDPHRVRQVIHNLLSNAIKFTDQGEITITLRNARDAPVEIEVRDTGIGMTAEQQECIFEDFTQADGSITRRFGGTGLGMSIVQRLMTLMNGTISVNSVLDEGTTVHLKLPLPVSDEAPVAQQTPIVDLSGLRLLVADDMRTNQLVLQALLSDTGAAITTVDNGAQAVDAWAGGEFDAVLLDISMPVMDGPSALAEMIRISDARNMPRPRAIAFTANVMHHQVEGYRAAGFIACIAKPLNKADLMAQIAAVAGRGRA